MSREPIELVVFDLGRVLVGVADDWLDACRRAGVTPREPLADGRLEALAALAHRYELGQHATEAFMREAAELADLSPAEMQRVSDAWLTGTLPGACELLEALDDAGIATACLSNTNDNHWRMMATPGGANHLPLGRMRHRFASHLLGLAKPDEAIYRHVERATGTPPPRILFFDDLEPNVAGARACGWRAERVLPQQDPIAQLRAHLAAYDLLR